MMHDSLFTEGGKLKTGLNCLHNFNNENRHYFNYGVEKDVLHLVEDLDRVMAKYIIKFAPISQHVMQEKGKSRDQKMGRDETRSL